MTKKERTSSLFDNGYNGPQPGYARIKTNAKKRRNNNSASTKNLAKQAHSRRTKQPRSPVRLARIGHSVSNIIASWLPNVIIIFVGLLIFLPLLPIPLPIEDNKNINIDTDKESVIAIDRDDDFNKTQQFLSNFVCHYKPSSIQPTGEKGNATTTSSFSVSHYGEGYCDPRLKGEPRKRTQQVSNKDHFQSSAPASSSSFVIRQLQIRREILTKIWLSILCTFKATKENPKKESVVIPEGTLIMRLPRPLQIWDLDALRDEFIQTQLLGLVRDLSRNEDSSNGESKIYDSVDNSSSKNSVNGGLTGIAAKHMDTHNYLDSGTYLAVYLIRRWRLGNGSWISKHEQDCRWDSNDPLLPYLEMLPTYSDRVAMPSDAKLINPHDHPLAWSESTLESMFPKYTLTYDLIRHYQLMVESEYEALVFKSPDEFGLNVKYTEYLGMRINVLSRAFGVAVSDSDDGVLWNDSIVLTERKLDLLSEISRYETSNFGSFLLSQMLDQSDLNNKLETTTKYNKTPVTFKFRSMCPLLDMYDSHPNPNVIWKYDSNTSSFTVQVSREGGIKSGHSIIVSYGKYTEGHLFSKYGYVNGDGSSPTEVSLAVFHRIIGDVGLGRQYSKLPFYLWDSHSRHEMLQLMMSLRGTDLDTGVQKSIHTAKRAAKAQAKELLRYLMFDDGYNECVQYSEGEANHDASASRNWELKLFKLRYLIHIANARDAWTVQLPARFPNNKSLKATGGENSGRFKEDAEDKVGLNAERLLSICRVISMTADDVGGNAIRYLEEGLSSTSNSFSERTSSFFHVEKQGDELEYRAMICVVRLCNVALGRYNDFAKLQEPEHVGSREWTAWYIRQGEMRVLNILGQAASKEANELKKRVLSSESLMPDSTAMIIRTTGACPIEYSMPLLGEL